MLPHLVESDFILQRNYTIVDAVDQTFGKWPSIYGNSFFIDSKHLLQDFVDMFRDNINTVLLRNNFTNQELIFTSELASLIKNTLTPHTIDQYALKIYGHLTNRVHQYVYDPQAIKRSLDRQNRLIGLENLI